MLHAGGAQSKHSTKMTRTGRTHGGFGTGQPIVLWMAVFITKQQIAQSGSTAQGRGGRDSFRLGAQHRAIEAALPRYSASWRAGVEICRSSSCTASLLFAHFLPQYFRARSARLTPSVCQDLAAQRRKECSYPPFWVEGGGHCNLEKIARPRGPHWGRPLRSGRQWVTRASVEVSFVVPRRGSGEPVVSRRRGIHREQWEAGLRALPSSWGQAGVLRQLPEVLAMARSGANLAMLHSCCFDVAMQRV